MFPRNIPQMSAASADLELRLYGCRIATILQVRVKITGAVRDGRAPCAYRIASDSCMIRESSAIATCGMPNADLLSAPSSAADEAGLTMLSQSEK